MQLTVFLVVLASRAGAAAGEVCDLPRHHDTGPLAIAAAQDKVLAQAFQKAALACTERSEACERARLECSGLLAAVAQKQASFDEGMWLRDLLLPYLGQQYGMTRPMGAFTVASDGSCSVDAASLTAAGQRRLAQSNRREALLSEYGLYEKWADATLEACKRRFLGAGQKPGVVAPESGRAVSVTEARQKAGEAAQEDVQLAEAAAVKAREDQRLREEAEARVREAQERVRQEHLAFEARDREDRRAERNEGEERARHLDEEKALAERSATVARLRAEKVRMVEEAELAYQQALANEESKRRAAVEAVSANPAVSQGAVAEAALAEKAREQAEQDLAEARFKAERLEIDDSFERSRGHLGVLGGGGATGWTDDSAAITVGPSIGALLTAHLGFWAPAPLKGLASGFEVAIGARVFKPFAQGPTPLELEGHVTARYFFGAFGVGAAGEFRVADRAFGFRPFGAGVALGVAVVDTPHVRVMLSGNWLPLGVAVDLARATGELEVSWQWFTFRVTGGSFTQRLTASAPVGWQAAVFAGARLKW